MLFHYKINTYTDSIFALVANFIVKVITIIKLNLAIFFKNSAATYLIILNITSHIKRIMWTRKK